MWYCFYDCRTGQTSLEDPYLFFAVEDNNPDVWSGKDAAWEKLVHHFGWKQVEDHRSFANEVSGTTLDDVLSGRLVHLTILIGAAIDRGATPITPYPTTIKEFTNYPGLFILGRQDNSNVVRIGSSRNAGGERCAGPCGNFSTFSEPNQPDGKTFICFSCRQR